MPFDKPPTWFTINRIFQLTLFLFRQTAIWWDLHGGSMEIPPEIWFEQCAWETFLNSLQNKYLNFSQNFWAFHNIALVGAEGMSDQLIWFVRNFIMDSLSQPHESLEILGNFFLWWVPLYQGWLPNGLCFKFWVLTWPPGKQQQRGYLAYLLPSCANRIPMGRLSIAGQTRVSIRRLHGSRELHQDPAGATVDRAVASAPGLS